MITLTEVYAAILHSWRLFRGDRGALKAFDASYDGFLRSFGVIVVLTPIYALVFVAKQKMILDSADADLESHAPTAFFLWEGVAALVDWVAFPLVVLALAPMLHINNRVSLFIVARNWTSILAALPYGVTALLYALGILSAEFLGLLWLIALGLLLYFRYQVYSAALGGPIPLVIGMVVLDFLLSLMIGETLGRLG